MIESNTIDGDRMVGLGLLLLLSDRLLLGLGLRLGLDADEQDTDRERLLWSCFVTRRLEDGICFARVVSRERDREKYRLA